MEKKNTSESLQLSTFLKQKKTSQKMIDSASTIN